MEQTHSWEDFLLKKGQIPHTENKKIRMLHIKGIKPTDKEALLFLLNSSFSSLEAFFTSNTTAAVILDSFPESFEDTVLGILEIIAFDLNMNLKLLVGNIHTVTDSLPKTFEEEHAMLPYLKEDLEYISHLYIQSVLSDAGALDLLYPHAFEFIKNDVETQNMIQAVWKNDGNVLQSATELYIHRNTIIYRMNKYHENTQLDLKKSNDRLISYLLTMRNLCKQ